MHFCIVPLALQWGHEARHKRSVSVLVRQFRASPVSRDSMTGWRFVPYRANRRTLMARRGPFFVDSGSRRKGLCPCFRHAARGRTADSISHTASVR